VSAVEMRGVSLSQGRNRVIENLSLEVAAGEFLVLLGPSGCGKSTLLSGIAGLLPVSGGSVWIDGVEVTHADPADRNIGMVFQSYALYPTMSVADNLSFALRVRGVPRREIAARVARTAELLQLTELMRRRPSELSGGQRQRVAMGRALVRNARLLLFDEPLSSLDASLRAELRRELKLLHRQLGATMIYVTHDQSEAMSLASRVAVMRAGRIEQVGAPLEVYERPANRFVGGFLGLPAMNFIEGVVGDGGSVMLPSGRYIAMPLCAAGRGALHSGMEVTLGWRAEHAIRSTAGPLEATVTMVDLHGSHAVVWLDMEGCAVSLLSVPDGLPAVGQAIRFGIEARRILVFERKSGVRL
jgi:multiple sugar transport system ATP-binding protein